MRANADHVANAQAWKVTIDGESTAGLCCHEADEEEGYIVCWFKLRVEDGVQVCLTDEDYRPRAYTRYGKVVITPPSEH